MYDYSWHPINCFLKRKISDKKITQNCMNLPCDCGLLFISLDSLGWFQTGKKIQFIKLDISNWRIGKIQCRQIGGISSSSAKPEILIIWATFLESSFCDNIDGPHIMPLCTYNQAAFLYPTSASRPISNLKMSAKMQA